MSRPKHIKESRFDFLKRTAEEHEASDTHESCLIWPFGTTDGYGVIAWARWPEMPSARSTERTHRVAFWLRHGRLPEPHGLHTCDDTLCYNWRHIYEGSDTENARDRVMRGLARGPKGEANPSAKLTASDVRKIRDLHRSGVSCKKIAKSFHVSDTTIERVVLNKTWDSV